ncbi:MULTISPECIES: molybdenum cofactor biosynthesis protein B [Methanobacterium]|jgi:molybdenum cofactor biosynthesis protein B|uniref:MogA/MoaB family molybdenum cofactor biosynthesis protein n=1 Tax=Methanobacterium veterum TaxID=408577 RepID=A0A9E4ZYT2_9EURY|nr:MULTISPECIES: MogA/MoaB family molybdenum cofactor biosynthesis protein [Methanobacterium]MCZ3364835.1 MogA/MoaB family molybdenum cofactor biosynthesis protein [Methanobacterium veterum]MCZ3372590.1 MogA/MoaB family molybdenum cofactor biosynthesis protein [Methanobacterium veterum]
MKSESMKEHKKQAPKSVNGAVITLSDSKYQDFLMCQKSLIFDDPRQGLEGHKDSDVSGGLIKDALSENNNLVFYSVIPDDAGLLVSTISNIIENYDVDVIITTGGTGIGPRDITIETLKPLFNKELNGFGEIFRYESYKELGTGAILSRATAGVYKNKLIIALPGSPNAVGLGLKIVMPELGHLVKHLRD